ncbi:alpha/beta fold hydrolase [Oceanobacillus arenosus]|uniref:alpha/beta fold hydrolase n=1 Tax=Oceanobacillus arenosus TaxID=1229153 RepID=UPI001FE3C59D|nr:alpha/beta hydrolase [Oceanobacillus arenosus]
MGFLSGKLDFVIDENGLSNVDRVMIGDINQTILIQAEDVTKPILLFLHGGPSMPIPGVSSKGRDYTIATNTKELVKNFMLVFWDQRGTGKSYNNHIAEETMNVSQFVADTIELTDYLRKRFVKKKIFLVGHSWGTVIGLKAASAFPEKYYSYVGISQIVNWVENDRLGLIWTKEEATRRKNMKALKELIAVGEPPWTESVEQWGVLRKWQRNFNTFTYKTEDNRYPKLLMFFWQMMQSKEYNLKDMADTFAKGFKLVYSDNFIHELSQIDFAKSTPKIAIPATFFHGRKDVHVYGKPVEDYVEALVADSGKQFVWFEKSAHAFHPDDTKEIEMRLIDELKYAERI